MSGYWVEVAPFQHGYEHDRFHCWAVVDDHPCRRGAVFGPDPLLEMKLCRQHAAQRDRNGFRIVRLNRDQLARAIADLDAEGD